MYLPALQFDYLGLLPLQCIAGLGAQARTNTDIQEMCRVPQCVDHAAASMKLEQNVCH